jgi:Sec-independent protein secretion pathway component TatC
MEKLDKDFIKKVNIDKANNKTIGEIIIIGISIATYIEPLINGIFDFGIIFEVASLIFLLLARKYMSKYDEIKAKRYIICSMLAIGWIIIYDIIFVFSLKNVDADVYGMGMALTILYLTGLFAINKDLAKAENPEKYKKSTDWFYERSEEENNEKNIR